MAGYSGALLPTTTGLGVVACLMLALAGCGPVPVTRDGPGSIRSQWLRVGSSLLNKPRSRYPPTVPDAIHFAEVSTESGIDFIHQSGMTPEFHFPSIFGSGVAIFDADGDGRMDLYFLTATRLPVDPENAAPNRLYKNLGNGRFEDVTASCGLGFAGFSLGVAVGDIDNDGDQDVFLTAFRQRMLYQNDGHGRFTDITRKSGLSSHVWSTCGAFLDYDNDGDLDLYVAELR